MDDTVDDVIDCTIMKIGKIIGKYEIGAILAATKTNCWQPDERDKGKMNNSGFF